METHSSILAWRIPWTEEPGGLHTVHAWCHKELDANEQLTHTQTQTDFLQIHLEKCLFLMCNLPSKVVKCVL